MFALVNYIGKYKPNDLSLSLNNKLNVEDCIIHLYLDNISE